MVDDGGTAEYEGLYLSAQKRLSHGLTAQANYTWSHCISDPYDFNSSSTGVAPPGNRRQWRSNCIGVDLRQLFVLNLVATTPRFSNRALRIVGSNWQIAPILELKSATFFTAFVGTDRALTRSGKPNPEPGEYRSVPSQSNIQQLDQCLGLRPGGSRHLRQSGL